MDCRLFRSETGVGTNDKFREFLLRAWFASEKCAENRSKKTEWDAYDPGICQRKEGRSLNKMALCDGNIRRVNSHN